MICMSPEIRNLGWRLNWYRQSELEGALLLGRMVRAANDSFLVQRLTRHAADEARHAAIWADAIAEAGLPVIRIFRSYQSLYGDHGGYLWECGKCWLLLKSLSAGFTSALRPSCIKAIFPRQP